jgi:hypothetical protein
MSMESLSEMMKPLGNLACKVLTRIPDVEVTIIGLAVMVDGSIHGTVQHDPTAVCPEAGQHSINSCGELHVKSRTDILQTLKEEAHGKTSFDRETIEETAPETLGKTTLDRETRSILPFESVECESAQDSA